MRLSAPPVKRLATFLAAAALATGAAAAGNAPLAQAGTNGQQIQLCTSVATVTGTATILGTNQNGLGIFSPRFPLVAFVGRCTPIWGWWWKGTVNLNWYHADGSFYRSSTCRVPVNQGLNNWVSCIAPDFGDPVPFDSTFKG